MFKEFYENARYCESFDPSIWIKPLAQERAWSPLLINGNAVMSENGLPILVHSVYMPVEGYREWLRAVYPEASWTENMTISPIHEKLSLLIVKTTLRLPDGRTFSANGIAKYNPLASDVDYMSDQREKAEAAEFTDTINVAMNYAAADAFKRAMENAGFGSGLDWEALNQCLPRYENCGNDLTLEVRPYDGKLWVNGEEWNPPTADPEFIESLSEGLSEEPIELVSEASDFGEKAVEAADTTNESTTEAIETEISESTVLNAVDAENAGLNNEAEIIDFVEAEDDDSSNVAEIIEIDEVETVVTDTSDEIEILDCTDDVVDDAFNSAEVIEIGGSDVLDNEASAADDEVETLNLMDNADTIAETATVDVGEVLFQISEDGPLPMQKCNGTPLKDCNPGMLRMFNDPSYAQCANLGEGVLDAIRAFIN